MRCICFPHELLTLHFKSIMGVTMKTQKSAMIKMILSVMKKCLTSNFANDIKNDMYIYAI